jgi:hypothetical protein
VSACTTDQTHYQGDRVSLMSRAPLSSPLGRAPQADTTWKVTEYFSMTSVMGVKPSPNSYCFEARMSGLLANKQVDLGLAQTGTPRNKFPK